MNKISQSGGIVVAYYPFGEDDRDVKEIDLSPKSWTRS